MTSSAAEGIRTAGILRTKLTKINLPLHRGFDDLRRTGLVSIKQKFYGGLRHGGTGKDRHGHRQSGAASNTRARIRFEQGTSRENYFHGYDFAHSARAAADAQ